MMLEIRNLEAGYGKKQVVFGLSLDIREGEIVALIGPNGAGKSTVLKAICGLIPTWKGEIRFGGVPTNGSTPAQNVARGMTFCPQGNRVFDELTVMENLEIGGFQLPKKNLKVRIEEVLGVFPVLKERLQQEAGNLSGGEQQMLSLSRAMVPRPRLLLLDEPSLGLSPNLVASVFGRIAEIGRQTGVAMLVVEQKVREVLAISQRVYSLKLGRVAFVGASASLKDDKNKLRDLFL